ncbi:polo-like kinase 3 [Mortierella sp. NVP41]|nr:polo-like kinase 3 [Mortierella sp. NVP41]
MSNPKQLSIAPKNQGIAGGTTTSALPAEPSKYINKNTVEVYAFLARLGQMRREIDMLGHAGKHEHIVKYFHSFEDQCGHGKCLLFKIYDSRNLHYLLANRWTNGQVVTEEEARYFGKQIAEGVAHLNSKGLIHGDLKPANILVDHYMNLKVADLGLAEIYTEQQLEITQAHHKRALTITRSFKMSAKAKDLITRLLNCDPKGRLDLDGIWFDDFFHSGNTPIKLPDTVFDKAPVFPKHHDHDASSAIGGQVDTVLSDVQQQMKNKKHRIEECCVDERVHNEEKRRTEEKAKIGEETHHVDKKHRTELSDVEKTKEEEHQGTAVDPQVDKHQSIKDCSEDQGQEEEDEEEAEDENESQQLSSNARQSAENYKNRIMRYLTFGEDLDSFVMSGDVGDDENFSLPSFPSF